VQFPSKHFKMSNVWTYLRLSSNVLFKQFKMWTYVRLYSTRLMFIRKYGIKKPIGLVTLFLIAMIMMIWKIRDSLWWSRSHCLSDENKVKSIFYAKLASLFGRLMTHFKSYVTSQFAYNLSQSYKRFFA